jgi:hypothetical protein
MMPKAPSAARPSASTCCAQSRWRAGREPAESRRRAGIIESRYRAVREPSESRQRAVREPAREPSASADLRGGEVGTPEGRQLRAAAAAAEEQLHAELSLQEDAEAAVGVGRDGLEQRALGRSEPSEEPLEEPLESRWRAVREPLERRSRAVRVPLETLEPLESRLERRALPQWAGGSLSCCVGGLLCRGLLCRCVSGLMCERRLKQVGPLREPLEESR